MTKKEKEMCREWYKRGIRDGRAQVVEGIFNAMGLDYHAFEHDPVSDVGAEEAFNTAIVGAEHVKHTKNIEKHVDLLDEKKFLMKENVNKVERWFFTLHGAERDKAQEALDDTVHDLYGNLASQINNAGPHMQIVFVFEQCGDEVWDVFGRAWDQWEWE